ILITCSNSLSQNYTYAYTFQIGKQVTINDALHYVKDRSKMITEASHYTIGEDIMFKDTSGEVTLSFEEDSNILQGISIDDIDEISNFDILTKNILLQMGNPDWGIFVEQNYDVKEKNILPDFKSYLLLLRYNFESKILYVYGHFRSMRQQPK